MIEIDAELGPVKRCPRCMEWWPADREFFYHTPQTPSGLQSWCIACWKDHLAQPEIRARRLAYGRAWAAEHRS